jgi:hypothetical protein
VRPELVSEAVSAEVKAHFLFVAKL